MCEDESNVDIRGISLYHGGMLFEEGWGELVNGVNDGIYRTVGMACVVELASGAERTLYFRMHAGGVDDEIYCRRGAILAIPLSDFENAYSSIQTVKSMHTTAQSNTTAILAAQACNAADHLVIAGVEVSNEKDSNAGFTHLISAGPVDFPAYNLDDRDEDAAEYYVNFMVHGVTLPAGNYDFAIQGDSDSDANEGAVNKAYLAVCEIPPVVVEKYIPKVIMVT